jgi:hypothetical protein
MGQDNRMCKCLTISEAHIVLKELDEGMPRRHFATYIITKKIVNVRYWWPTLFKDTHEFYRSYDSCKKIGGLKTKSLAKLVITFLEKPFMKCGLDFISPIKPTRRLTINNTF